MQQPPPLRLTRSRQHKNTSPNGLKIVNVTRPGKWGNPFRVVDLPNKKWGVRLVKYSDENAVILTNNTHLEYEHKSEALTACIECFKEYAKKFTPAELEELRGCNLMCWCSVEPCHSSILITLSNK